MILSIDLVFLVLLLGHVLGDFYFQTDKMAGEKKEKYAAALGHALVYAGAMTAVLWAAIPAGQGLWMLCLWAGLSHFIIDSAKFLGSKKLPARVQEHIFLADQLLHLAALWGVWYLWGQAVQVRPFVSAEIAHLPALPVTMTLAVLLMLRPVGIFIGNSGLQKYRPAEPGQSLLLTAEPAPRKNAGKTIGYLERLIVFALLMYGQFSAIAFVLTAKSVARFKSIEQNQALAEYYLIGTLMSVGAAFVITVLLGLCRAAN